MVQGQGRLDAGVVEGASNLRLGPGVFVSAKRVLIGRDVEIGTMEDIDAFRYPGGTVIQCTELILGDRVRVGRHVSIRGGTIEIKRDSVVGHGSTINVHVRLTIGESGRIHENCEIAGRIVEIGRQLWMLSTAKIGGGSASEVHSSFKAGHWLHLGVRTFINTARPVVLGDEVGLGTGTCLYTHGAYASALDGKPVAFGPISVGDRTWLPGAVVNPSVTIGNDCVIGVGSVVTRDIPPGALAAGTPAKVLRDAAYPKPLAGVARVNFVREFLRTFSEICSDRHDVRYIEEPNGASAIIDRTLVRYSMLDLECDARNFDAFVLITDSSTPTNIRADRTTIINLSARTLDGMSSTITERLLNQLRRYGIRFNYESREGVYRRWG